VTAAVLHPSVSVMPRFYARAKQHLFNRGRLDDAREPEIESLAQSLRYEEFRRQIEPFERQRNHAISQWLMLQTDAHAAYPPLLQETVDLWNEAIASEARKFGYEPSLWSEP